MGGLLVISKPPGQLKGVEVLGAPPAELYASLAIAQTKLSQLKKKLLPYHGYILAGEGHR
jgi:hypothetical protein